MDFPLFWWKYQFVGKNMHKRKHFCTNTLFWPNYPINSCFFWQWQFRLAKPPSAQKLWNFRCLYVQCVCLLTNIAVVLITIFDLIAGRGRQTGQMSRKYCRRWNIQILVENMSDIRQQLISMPSARRAFSVAWPTGNQCKSLQTTHVTRFLFLSQMYFKSFSTDFTKYKYLNRSGNKTHD